MKKFSTIFILMFGLIASVFNSACQSTQYHVAEISQTMMGYMKVEKDSPDYRFYFCDINHHFVGYIDTREVVTSGFERLIDKPVVLRGRLVDTEKGRVIYADNIKLNALK